MKTCYHTGHSKNKIFGKPPEYDDDDDDYDDEKKRKQPKVQGTKSDHTLQLYDMNRGFPLCYSQFFYML